jgi:hypothetical protein
VPPLALPPALHPDSAGLDPIRTGRPVGSGFNRFCSVGRGGFICRCHMVREGLIGRCHIVKEGLIGRCINREGGGLIHIYV